MCGIAVAEPRLLEALLARIDAAHRPALLVFAPSDADRAAVLEVVARRWQTRPRRWTRSARPRPGDVFEAPASGDLSLAAAPAAGPPAGDPPAAGADPVETFFRSLADRAGERAVAVDLLGGAGGDGMAYLRMQGGVGLRFEREDDAGADSQPDPARLGEIVRMLVDDSAAQPATGIRQAPLPSRQEIREICEIIRRDSGHDFRHYKMSTLVRRVMRRIRIARCDDADAYISRLEGDSEEIRALIRDLLIGVTGFFRDPEAFAALEQRVLNALIVPSGHGLIRIWVAGCSTGQEAYSIAMLARERLDAVASSQEVQIFATDLDERALSVARKGSFTATAVAPVGRERLERHFERIGRRWQAGKALRQMIVFSPHNLIADPPFSRMDLISCRNLLIYLGAHLQKKLMSVFHYALRDSGYLFLGSSEAVTGHGDLFRVVDARARIAQRRDTGIGGEARTRPVPATGGGRHTADAPPDPADTRLISQRILLDEFAPPYVLANEDGQVTYVSSGASAYLTQPEGEFVNQLMRMIRPGVRTAVRTAWSKALRSRRREVADGLVADGVGERRRLRVTVQPMPELGEGTGSYMVVFQDLGASSALDAVVTVPGPDNERLFEELEAELLEAREQLERTVQDLEAANEELKSSNEELLSMNEELQSANEELEASREEIENSNAALEAANSDLVNLLESTGIATIFLDARGRLRRFTPPATEIYNVTALDVGRPLEHFTHRLRSHPSPAPVGQAVTVTTETEVRHDDGRYFLRRVTPYRDQQGQASGSVITFIDITQRRAAEDDVRRLRDQLQFVTDHAPVMLAHLDRRLQYRFVNEPYAALFGRQPVDIVGRSARSVLGPQVYREAQPRLKAALGGETVDFNLSMQTSEGARVLRAVYAPDRGPNGRVNGLIAGLVDITDFSRAEQALHESEARFKAFQQATPEGFMILRALRNRRGRITDFIYDYVNPAGCAIVGREVDELIGQRLLQVMPGNKTEGLFDAYIEVVETRRPYQRTLVYAHDGLDKGFELTAVPIGDGFAVTFADVSERMLAERRVRESQERLLRLIDNIVAFVGMLSPDGRLTDVNEPAILASGLSREAVIGRPFWEIEWWPEVGDIRRNVADACRRAALGEASRYDTEVLFAGGVPVKIDFQLVPVRDAQGRIIELVASGVDINERVVAESALIESRRQLQETLDALAVMVALLTVDGRVSNVNQTALEASGTTLPELAGRPFVDMPWWDDDTPARPILREMLDSAATGQASSVDLPWRDRDGAVRWAAVQIVPVRDGGDDVAALVVSGTDITQRKRIEQNLAEGRERLQLATMAARLGTFDFDPQSGLVVLDARAREILDAPSSSMPLGEILAFVHPEDAPAFADALAVAARSGDGNVRSLEFRIRGPEGGIRWIESHSLIVAGPDGRANRWVGTVRDVTTGKTAQAHQALLLGELNHRVKNSLATIQAMASQTLRHATDLPAFRDAFMGRLSAIAAAHDILVGNQHAGADLEALIVGQVGPYADLEGGRVQLSGPRVVLAPTVAHALAMTLHELATNAAKYGALSRPEGRIAIDWTVEGHDGAALARISWRESGGPTVDKPTRRGFGSRLIEATLSHAIGGRALLSYPAEGVRAELIVPLADEEAAVRSLEAAAIPTRGIAGSAADTPGTVGTGAATDGHP